MEKEYNSGFWAFIEKHIFSKLPNYKLRLQEIDQIKIKNDVYTDSFINNEPHVLYSIEEKSDFKSHLIEYYKKKMYESPNFIDALYTTMKESNDIIHYSGKNMPEYGVEKLFSDFNIDFLKDLGVDWNIVKKREMKFNSHNIGTRSFNLTSIENEEHCTVSFSPKMMHYIKRD